MQRRDFLTTMLAGTAILYIKEFLLALNRELGRKHGVEYAEAFHYIGPGTSRVVEEYIHKHAVPLK
jgi:hypothetical protein